MLTSFVSHLSRIRFCRLNIQCLQNFCSIDFVQFLVVLVPGRKASLVSVTSYWLEKEVHICFALMNDFFFFFLFLLNTKTVSTLNIPFIVFWLASFLLTISHLYCCHLKGIIRYYNIFLWLLLTFFC